MQLKGHDLLVELQNRKLFRVWCMVLAEVNTEMKNYQPIHKAEYLLFRTGINPTFFARNFAPLASSCEAMLPQVPEQRNATDQKNRFPFVENFRPTGARNLHEVIDLWQGKLRDLRQELVIKAIAGPLVLFLLGVVLLGARGDLRRKK